jgi:hypothetical protein
MLDIEELSDLERLKLSLKYSTSEKHKKSLKSKIEKIEGKKEPEPEEGQLSLF